MTARPASGVTLVAALWLAGCATAAQQQAQQAEVRLREAAAASRECQRSVATNPDYAALLPHTPEAETGLFVAAQLTNETKPAPAEARLWAARHDASISCRKQDLRAVGTDRPDLIPVLMVYWTQTDQTVMIPVVQRTITWGEAARRSQTALTRFREGLATANRSFASDMLTASKAEVARRQGAISLFTDWIPVGN